MSAPNILLVDDEPSVLRYTKTLLEIDNYKVETASSGEEALQRMEQGPAPNLILLDLILPGIDGLQTLESCKKIRPEQKVLMMSCLNDTSESGAGDQAGCVRLSDQAISTSTTARRHPARAGIQ